MSGATSSALQSPRQAPARAVPWHGTEEEILYLFTSYKFELRRLEKPVPPAGRGAQGAQGAQGCRPPRPRIRARRRRGFGG